MLAKCANSECSHVFRIFGEGKLFRLSAKKSPRKAPTVSGTMEHFWLCPNCAPMMTIAVDRNGKTIVLPRAFVRTYREVVGRVSRVPEISAALLQNSGLVESRL